MFLAHGLCNIPAVIRQGPVVTIDTCVAASLHWQEPVTLLRINGERVDQFVARFDPKVADLIPSWTEGALNVEELEIVIATLELTLHKTTANVPILVCPDDADLFCTVIVAEVSFEPEADVVGLQLNLLTSEMPLPLSPDRWIDHIPDLKKLGEKLYVSASDYERSTQTVLERISKPLPSRARPAW